jgi:hypothetical protein
MKGAKGVLVGLVATKDGYMIGISVAGQEMLVMEPDQALSVLDAVGTLLEGLGLFEEDDGEPKEMIH